MRNLTDFGAFVEVEEDIDGLIHISDMSWSKRIKHPSEVLKKGDGVEAMVLNIDAENQRLSLGLKQLATDIWDDFFSRHQVGETIEGKVVRVTNFGAFVELDEGIEGLIHVSELDDQRGREDRAEGGREHADEDHQAGAGRAEDRPEHPGAEVATSTAPTGTRTRRRPIPATRRWATTSKPGPRPGSPPADPRARRGARGLRQGGRRARQIVVGGRQVPSPARQPTRTVHQVRS